MRLDRYLSENGYGSRKNVKILIEKGRVRVDGETRVRPETQVAPGSAVFVDGKPVEASSGFEYWLLNKPAGFVTARTDGAHRTVMELIPSKKRDLSPVGRLDLDVTGVLLVTDDGALNHRLTAPRNCVPKTYFAELSDDLPEDAAKRLSVPIQFSDFTSRPAELEALSKRSARITVYEGRFHEVKRLFHAIGCDVVRLHRERFAGLNVEGLREGEARRLTEEETDQLRRYGLPGGKKENDAGSEDPENGAASEKTENGAASD